MVDILTRPDDDRYQGRWYGKYRAFVRDHHDPERLGRCRLEIPAVLGTGADHWSSWAWPCFPYGGNADTGMFLVPEEGASVWAEFEGGDPQYPIWTGVWLAGSNPGEQPQESIRLCSQALCQDCGDQHDHQANRSDQAEHQPFHGHPPYACPRMKVLLKTETGHTIVADDADAREALRILDRVGQVLEMVGPVKASVQAGNSRPRGNRSAAQGNPLPLGDLVEAKAHVELLDACRQSLRLQAWRDREQVHLLSCDATRSRWQKIILDTTKGRERLILQGLNGTQTITIDSTAGRESITLTDTAGSRITLAHGQISIKAAGLVRINT